MKRSIISLGMLLAALCVSASIAAAEDVWTTPYPGVRHLHRRVRQQEIHAAIIDLTQAGLSVVSTRPEGARTTTSAFARRVGAVVAVNANWFGHTTCGLAAGEGVVWPDAYGDHCDASMGFGPGRAEAFDSHRIPRGPLPRPWMTEAVSGKPWLVKQGRRQGPWTRPRRMDDRAPRTAAGVTQDGRTLILVVADGRARDVSGLTGEEIAQVMVELGAWDAINLDGGGSSTLFIAAEGGVVNRYRGSRQRVVGNHLGIRIAGQRPGSATQEETDAEARRRRIERDRARQQQQQKAASKLWMQIAVLPQPGPRPRRRDER